MIERRSGKPLAVRQRQVLRLIGTFYARYRLFPSVEFLARQLGVHRSTVQEHLAALHRKGFLRAPVPGKLIRGVPPLPTPPIPEREGEDVTAAEPAPTIHDRVVSSPSLPEPVRVETRTAPGETRPSIITVGTGTKIRRMKVLREGGPDGPITGFEVEDVLRARATED